VNAPDENLMELVEKVIIKSGKALDIGCGNGRNTFYLMENGYNAQGLDFSQESIKWANQKKSELGSNQNPEFINQSFFDFESEIEVYDLIHDSGCLHHIKPHRRHQYLSKIRELLKPEGHFTLTCFNEKGGVNISDHDVYRKASMQGGLGYSEYKLKTILYPYFEIIEFREMKSYESSDRFGTDICWTVLMKKCSL